MVSGPPLVTKEFKVWKSRETAELSNTTSFAFISFRMSTASVMEGTRGKVRSLSTYVMLGETLDQTMKRRWE